MSNGKTEKLAVLIDADNAQPSIVEGLLSEIAKYGTANAKRIYGDWTQSGLKGGRKFFYSIQYSPYSNLGILQAKMQPTVH